MKRYMKTIGFIALISGGFCYGASLSNQAYEIEITNYGDDALVQAIQKYSNITKADVDKWKYEWAPVVGPYVRSNIMVKIRNFVRVCQGVYFAKDWFDDKRILMSWAPANWTEKKICLALKNLENQGDYALALFGQVRAITQEETELKNAINRYLHNIRYNRLILKCSDIKQSAQAKDAKKLLTKKNKAELEKLYWHTMTLRLKMAKEVSTTIFQGTKWAVQNVYKFTVDQPKVSFASAAALYYLGKNIFGIGQSLVK